MRVQFKKFIDFRLTRPPPLELLVLAPAYRKLTHTQLPPPPPPNLLVLVHLKSQGGGKYGL